MLGEGNSSCLDPDIIALEPSAMSVVSAGRKSESVNMDGSVGHIPVAWKPLIAVFIVALWITADPKSVEI